MALLISNIILYDKSTSVMGYVELKNENDRTHINIQHNLNGQGLIFSLSYKDQTHVYQLTSNPGCAFEIDYGLDLSREIFVFITRKTEKGLVALASGAINIQEKLVESSSLHFESMSESKREIESQAMQAVQEPDQPEPEIEIEWTEPEANLCSQSQQSAQHLNVESNTVELKSTEVLKRAKEVDEVLRAVCSFEEGGENACKSCPYREHFFRKTEVGQG